MAEKTYSYKNLCHNVILKKTPFSVHMHQTLQFQGIEH